MELVILIGGLIMLNILALRFGADSRILDPRRREPSLLDR
jgi:hypothetical protein